MMYLWSWAVGHGDFGITERDQPEVLAFIKQYLLTCLFLITMVWQGLHVARAGRLCWLVGLDLWFLMMMLRGDESTRIAVDILVALFTGQDMATFEYRANVWVWWTKVAV